MPGHELAGASATVTAPATSANLGPGFDSLGLALEIRDVVTAKVEEGDGFTAEVHIEGHGAGTLPRDESHLIVRLIEKVWRSRGIDSSGARILLHARNEIPHARGLGSSAAAIMTGLVLGSELLPQHLRLTQDELFQWGSRLEGHPDNIAPALFGGLTVSWSEGSDSGSADDLVFSTLVAQAAPALTAVVGIPDFEVRTDAVRAALPATVPHADAAANSGRSALLTLALTSAPEHLLAATRDYLHQEARATAMQPSFDAVTSLRADGVPAVISGAGPTVLALARTAEESARAQDEFSRRGFSVRLPKFCDDGVRVMG